jgi:hypothetical protein
MKVDVEGADYLALRGASRLVSEHRPIVFFEYSPDFLERLPGSSVAGLQGWFVEHEYQLDIVGFDGTIVPAASLDAATEYLRANRPDHLDMRASPKSIV